MQLPSYYLSRPPANLTTAIRDEFEELFDRSISRGAGDFIEYSSPAPKWQFLSYLVDHKEVVLHGTGDPEIAEFEPRQSNDSSDFGNQNAVYAASDALWATYFAVMDRERHVRSLVNTCFRVIDPAGTTSSHYYFSINADALPHKPWRPGTVYILPRESFEQQKSSQPDRESTQWRSFVAVKPLAKVSVEPADFPFLDRVRGHDFSVVQQRAVQDPDGFPWLDE